MRKDEWRELILGILLLLAAGAAGWFLGRTPGCEHRDPGPPNWINQK